MARPLRILVPGGWYHVVNRGNRRQSLFLDDEDRRRFLRLLAELPERFGVEVHAFVLMDNHYHLLVRIRETNLSHAIRWLQISYGSRFNWAHGVSGHVFQGRFRADLIQEDRDAAEVARYIHLNPVRVHRLGLGKAARQHGRVAGVEDPGRERVNERLEILESYPWSSWRYFGGAEPAPAWLETEFVGRCQGGRSRTERLAALRQYTEAPLRQGHLDRPWDRLVGGCVLGDADYARQLLAQVKSNREEQTGIRRLAREGRISWEELVARAENERGMSWADMISRHGEWGRDGVIYVAVRYAGYRLAEIFGRIPGLKYQAAVQGMKRFTARLEEDETRRRFVKRLTA